MSVLLEALKKAAEDKKKALENSGQSNKVEASHVQEDTSEKNTMLESSVDSEVLDLKLQDTLNKPAEIKLSLNEDVVLAPREDINQPEIIKNTPPLASKEVPDVALKLDLNLGKAQKTENSSNSSKISGEEPTDIKPQASLKLAIEGSAKQNNSSFDKSVPAETASFKATQATTAQDNPLDNSTQRNIDISDEPVIELTIDAIKEASIASDPSSEKTKENEGVELHLAKNNLDKGFITPDFTKSAVGVLKDESLDDAPGLSKSEQVTVSNDATPTPLNADFDRNVQREGVVSDPEKNSIQLNQDSVQPLKSYTEKSFLKEDEDSYKWSLDALPGYLGLGRKKNKKTIKSSTEAGNPILVAGALSEDPARPSKKSSVKLIVILLVLLLLIGILFYGALYYQEQHDALEQRMKKYNLVKTHISIEKESGTVNQQPENRVDSPEKNISEERVSQVSLPEEVASKESLVYAEKSDSFGENDQTRMETAYQGDVETPVSSEAAISKREIVTQPAERKMSNRVVNASTISTQMSEKKVTETANNAPSKAVIVVQSEEKVLSEAYLSYGQGDFSRAQQAFETVLTMNPNNEFALIGLGNILASDQQYSAAMSFYQKALAAQPSSLNAFEAMANISGHIELNSDWKNALSGMAQDHSESATLQYALGNVYAEENDWLSAQSAYFQAVALEPDNADYLVNLAVSLDQLGKYQLAARYYTEALAFVDVEAVNFNEAQVKNRLISIRQFMAGRAQ